MKLCAKLMFVMARSACIFLALAFAAGLGASDLSAQSFSIAVTVNDEPISAWDVEQRVKFYQATGQGGKGAEALRKRATDELIEELLISQEARRVGVSVDDQRVTDAINQRLQPLQRTYPQFKQYLSGQGVDIVTLENQLRSQLAWASVIAQTYRSQVSIADTDIEEAVGRIDSEDQPEAEEVFALQRIVLEVPEGAGDAAIVERMEEAEKLRQQFIDCERNKSALKRLTAASIEEMPDTRPDSLQEPTRSLVLQASAGQMTPPNLTQSGVEMFAVCERRADGGLRQKAERSLLNQELGMLASRHLRDLRQDAVVDQR
jgi:peptidyl-prolyl cis-trans isomerase SurA